MQYPSPTVYQELRISSQSFTETQIKPFYCKNFVIAPVKGFRLVHSQDRFTRDIFS